MSELTYLWQVGLPEPLRCEFEDMEDGFVLRAVFAGDTDIYQDGNNTALFNDGMVARIENAASATLERQAAQINAERRYELFSGTREALGQLSIRRAA